MLEEQSPASHWPLGGDPGGAQPVSRLSSRPVPQGCCLGAQEVTPVSGRELKLQATWRQLMNGAAKCARRGHSARAERGGGWPPAPAALRASATVPTRWFSCVCCRWWDLKTILKQDAKFSPVPRNQPCRSSPSCLRASTASLFLSSFPSLHLPILPPSLLFLFLLAPSSQISMFVPCRVVEEV